jgi:hypothetical protein
MLGGLVSGKCRQQRWVKQTHCAARQRQTFGGAQAVTRDVNEWLASRVEMRFCRASSGPPPPFQSWRPGAAVSEHSQVGRQTSLVQSPQPAPGL